MKPIKVLSESKLEEALQYRLFDAIKDGWSAKFVIEDLYCEHPSASLDIYDSNNKLVASLYVNMFCEIGASNPLNLYTSEELLKMAQKMVDYIKANPKELDMMQSAQEANIP